MDIYNWDMIITKVEKHRENDYTPNKNYEVRDGKIIIDRDYAHSNKRFSLNEFLKSWDGDWLITRVNIDGKWYKIESK